MIVSLRAALPSQLRTQLAAVRSCLLLAFVALVAASAHAQSLTPGGPINFGAVQIGASATRTLTFTAPPGGTNIQSVNVVTKGTPNQDFRLVSDVGCVGMLNYLDQCVIVISFSPTEIGTRLGALTITDTTNTIVNLVYLSGVGVGPQFVFAPTTPITTASAATLSPAAFTAGSAVQDGNGNLFFTDVRNNRILERSSTNVYFVVNATLPVTATSGITMDGLGVLYVSSGSAVYGFMPGATPPLVPTPGITLTTPTGLTVDGAGDLYIADSGNNKIYQVPIRSNSATALALTGPGAALLSPTGLGIDSNNDLFVADSGHNRIVEIPIRNLTTSVVTLTTLTLSNPTGVAIDGAGTVYIANTGGAQIIEATTTGAQFILSENPNPLTLATPAGIVLSGNGDIVLADTTLGLIDIHRSTPAINFPTATKVGSLDTIDDPESLTVQNTGNVITALSFSSTSTNPSISTSAFLLGTAPTNACPILNAGAAVTSADNFAPGEVCIYAIDFKPIVIGPNLANLILTTSGSGQSTSNTIPLSGNGLASIAYFVLVASPNVTTLGAPVSLTLTAYRSDGTIATDYVGTVTFTDTDSTSKYLSGTGAGTGTTTYTFTAANAGVLNIPAATGLQFNHLGVFTAFATDGTFSATSNSVRVVEPSTLTLTSSINPSQVGQQTVFTLNVSSPGPAPTGTVTFYVNGVAIGTSAITAGTATLAYSFSAIGTYAITALYSGDVNTNAGSAGPLSQQVVNSTVITLTSSVNPSLVGQSTTLTGTISALGTPTGTIKFYDGATLLGTVNVSGNTGALAFSFTTTGTHVLTAVYSGDARTNAATSAPLNQVVLNIAAVTLTSTVNPSLLTQTTTLTATVTSLATPTGTVKFYDGTTLLGTVNLTGSAASLAVSFATSGTHTLTAVYSGDTLTQTITSAPYAQVVLNATTISLTTSVNPVAVNANTTLTSTVASSGTPTGSVTFFAGATRLGTATLSSGIARLVVSFPTAGTYALTAVYSGDSSNQTATSAPVSQVVQNAVTIILSSSSNPVFLDNGTILTALLTSTGPTPTGTISFFDSGTPLGTGIIVNGAVSLSATFVYSGPHTLSAVYSGDAVTAPASAPAFTETVTDFSFAPAAGASTVGLANSGGTAAYSLALTPLITSTLPSGVSITVTGLPSGVTQVLTPALVAAGSGVTPVALSVTPLLVYAALPSHGLPHHRSPARYAPAALAFLALPLAWFRRRKRFGSLLASLCLLFAITAGLTGCISGFTTGYYGQTPHTYNLTVTATSGNLTRSTYLTLNVQ